VQSYGYFFDYANYLLTFCIFFFKIATFPTNYYCLTFSLVCSFIVYPIRSSAQNKTIGQEEKKQDNRTREDKKGFRQVKKKRIQTSEDKNKTIGQEKIKKDSDK